ncbi:MAG: hypothetical protein ACFB9M_20910 [Myxococcota bacterium]
MICAFVCGLIMVGQVDSTPSIATASTSTTFTSSVAPTAGTSSVGREQRSIFPWTGEQFREFFFPSGEPGTPPAPTVDIPAESPGSPLLQAFLRTLLYAAILAVILGGGRRLLPMPRRLRSLLPLIEVGIWLGFLGWASSVWIRSDPLWGLVLLGLLVSSTLPLAWSLSGDLLAGVWIGLEGGLDEGLNVYVDGRAGVLKRLGVRWAEVETEDRWVYRIPYRKLHEQIGVRRSDSNVLVRVHLDAPQAMDGQRILRRAVEVALSSPWCSVVSSPRVRTDDEGHIILECYAVAEDGVPLLRADLMAAWSRAFDSSTPPAPKATSAR